MSPLISKAYSLLRSKKNLILQDAPGTGKTYNTAIVAVALIDGQVAENHDDVMARYQELRDAGRIGFTTFHQSMDYEDFVEDIKPVHEGGTIRYEVVDGIFKRICNAAQVATDIIETGSDNIQDLNLINANPTIWKVSLGGKGIYRDYTEALRLEAMLVRRQDISLSERENIGQDYVPVFRFDMALLFEHYALALLREQFGTAILYQVKGFGGRFVADFLLNTPSFKAILDTKYVTGYDSSTGYNTSTEYKTLTEVNSEYIKQLSGYARDKSLLGALGIDCTDEDVVPVVPCMILYPLHTTPEAKALTSPDGKSLAEHAGKATTTTEDKSITEHNGKVFRFRISEKKRLPHALKFYKCPGPVPLI